MGALGFLSNTTTIYSRRLSRAFLSKDPSWETFKCTRRPPQLLAGCRIELG